MVSFAQFGSDFLEILPLHKNNFLGLESSFLEIRPKISDIHVIYVICDICDIHIIVINNHGEKFTFDIDKFKCITYLIICKIKLKFGKDANYITFQSYQVTPFLSDTPFLKI